MNRLASVLIVASFDFAESIRSRKSIALMILFLIGSLGATGFFIRFVQAVEEALAETLAVSTTSKVGTMTSTLFDSELFRRAVWRMVGDREVADAIVGMPPLALFYASLSLGSVPLLAVLFSCDAVSGEVATGASRFSLFRVDRLTYALGKLGGQALLLLLGLLVGAVACYGLGAYYLASFDYTATAAWMLRMSVRAWIYGLPYLGLALAVSQATRSVNWSRALALSALFAVAIVGALLEWDRVQDWSPTLVQTAQQMLPSAHRLDLWRPSLLDRLPALVMLPALAAVAFSIGYLRFQKRDG